MNFVYWTSLDVSLCYCCCCNCGCSYRRHLSIIRIVAATAADGDVDVWIGIDVGVGHHHSIFDSNSLSPPFQPHCSPQQFHASTYKNVCCDMIVPHLFSFIIILCVGDEPLCTIV